MNDTPQIPEAPPRDDRKQRLEQRFKFRRVDELTGTFVLVVVGLLIAAVLWMGHSQRWFKSRVTLRIALPATGAAGIRQGSEVYFLGTLVGSVSDVAVDASGRMEAEAGIRRDFFRFVRADSSAVVKKKFGVAGDSFFEITRGEGRPLPEKNAAIVCNEQFQSALESAIEDVRREAMLVLKKTGAGLDAWTKLGVDLDETRQHLDQVAIHLETLVTNVAAGKGTAGRLIVDPAIADEAQKLLTQANATMGELQSVATNLNIAAARLPAIAGDVADGTKDLPGLVSQTQTSMRELERLIEALQRHWLIRKHVNQTNPPPLQPRPEAAGPEKKPGKAGPSQRGR